MNISQIKAMITVKAAIPGFTCDYLSMNTQKDQKSGAVTDFVSHWDDTHRVRVSMHRDILTQVTDNPAFSGLALKPAEVITPAGKLPYKRFIIITPKSIEATL